MKTSRLSAPFVVLFLLLVDQSIFAQSAANSTLVRTVDDGIETVRLEISPAAPSVPALKYRFYYRDYEKRPGNRATFYRRTFDSLDRTHRHLFTIDSEFDARAEEHQIDLEKLRQSAEFIARGVYPKLADAVNRREIDWGFRLGDLEGKEALMFALPEVQPMQTASRLLSVKSRHEIETGQFDEAIETIRVGYQLSYDIADGESFVHKLVGIAMAAISHSQVAQLAATPNSPNLYWALASLNDPFIDMRSAIRHEAETCFRVFPILNKSGESHSAADWTRMIGDAIVDGFTVLGGGTLPISPEMPDWQRRVVATAMIAAAYPDAKRQLIGIGMNPDEIESLPAGQVVVMQQARVVEFITDEMEKTCYAPTYAPLKPPWANEPFGDTPVGREYFPVATLLTPAMNAARAAQLRTQREIASLQVIEAIRAHLTNNGGRLPDTLDAVTILPVPLNPITSKPFLYWLKGETGILELPANDIPAIGYTRRYEIVARK